VPVEKFATLEDAEKALYRRPFGDDGPERIRRLWHRQGRLAPRRFPPGVRKYRTFEEADADRLRWLRKENSTQSSEP